MKTIEELDKIKQETLKKFNFPGPDSEPDGIRVVVGMATCGIAAGARPILKAFQEEIAKHGIKNAVVEQTGCMGVCKYEPIAEIYMPGLPRTTYVNVTTDKVAQIVSEHLVHERPCTRYTIGAEETVS